MKIALICPSNMLYMPYISNYTRILDEINVDYNVIIWDRFGIEKVSEFTYRDSKIGHQRNFLDYYKYSRFALRILKENNYDKVIVFGIQLVFFLKRSLIREYTNKFVIDIRDYNVIIKYFNIKKAIDNSSFTVLSSPGYNEWLPKNNKYIINHNTQIESLDELKEVKISHSSIDNKISVGCIGALRDYKVNISFIESLKNSIVLQLNYHGEGNINKNISKFLIEYNIENVDLTGRYNKEEEPELYNKNNIINVLRYNDGINNRTALPNRLYNAAIYGKPMLAFEGTQLAQIIKDYDLGLVLNTFDQTAIEIVEYLNYRNTEKFDAGRRKFLCSVIQDNIRFKEMIKRFSSYEII